MLKCHQVTVLVPLESAAVLLISAQLQFNQTQLRCKQTKQFNSKLHLLYTLPHVTFATFFFIYLLHIISTTQLHKCLGQLLIGSVV